MAQVQNERGPEGVIFGVENVNGTNYADAIMGDLQETTY